jgi:hypothetical protein
MLSASLFGVGIIYLVLDTTIGKIKVFRSKFEWHGLQIKDFVFLIIAIVILLTFFEIKQPYK